MKSRLIMFFISLWLLVFIVSLTRSIWALWQKRHLISDRILVRDHLKEENRKLSEELNQAQSLEFIEREAREKLNLQREGEIVVVLPKNLASPQPQFEAKTAPPNWQLWLKLFF